MMNRVLGRARRDARSFPALGLTWVDDPRSRSAWPEGPR